MNTKIKVAIVGPTGYTGLHLIQLLLKHPHVELSYLASHREQLPNMADEYPQLLGLTEKENLQCKPIDADAIAKEADVAFLALPHKAAMAYAPKLLAAGLTVIDLSADYRLKSQTLYEEIYQTPHEDPEHLADAIYGLPELFRDQIPTNPEQPQLIANPGCYPTAAALAITPLIRAGLVKTNGIVISAASGTTGAGKSPSSLLHFPEQNESYFAYGEIGSHRHTPEIDQTLTTIAGHEIQTLFVPHLLPTDRGILESIYLDPTDSSITQAQLDQVFEDAYANEPFVRLRNTPPNIKHVRDTNFCDICVKLTPQGKIIVFSVIDNMIKGASGQAIQNMNRIFGLPETTGLI